MNTRENTPEHVLEPSFARPPRDTGLMFEGRAARERRRRTRVRRRALFMVAAAAAAVLVTGWLLSQTAPKPAMRTAVASGAPAIMRAGDPPGESPLAAADPTPLFAAFKDVALHVPVPTSRLTEIAFHQASYDYAQHLVTRLETFPMEKAKGKRGTGRSPGTSVADAHGWLGGYVLRLWRSRPGKPDSAADVGAPAGTPVLAPVTGEVLKVKAYRLYGKYPDFEVHIRPSGHDDLDVVLIHIADPRVAPGDRTVGGETPVGSVRKLSNKLHLQLADYSRSPGDHTHMQVNHVKPGTTEAVASAK